jgi:hypothetical protein
MFRLSSCVIDTCKGLNEVILPGHGSPVLRLGHVETRLCSQNNDQAERNKAGRGKGLLFR